MTFGEKSELVFLGKEITEGRNYSEEVAAQIDEEVKTFIRNAQKTAGKVLKQRKLKLKQQQL